MILLIYIKFFKKNKQNATNIFYCLTKSNSITRNLCYYYLKKYNYYFTFVAKCKTWVK